MDQLKEQQVLLQACRRAETIAKVSELDWPWLLHQAIENGIVPLLYQAVKDCRDVPQSVRAQLMEAWAASVAQGLRLADELTKIVSRFRELEIPLRAYKGPVLSMLAYGNPTARAFGDLDIIVRREDVGKATSALEAMGFRCTLSPQEHTRFLRDRYHLHFSSDPRTNVELHWAITPAYWPFPLDQTRLWNGTTTVEILGQPTPTLDRELTVLAICAHGAKERWPRLGLVCDLDQLVRHSPDLDWTWIRQQADDAGRSRVLRLGVYLAASLLETPVPMELLAEAQADAVIKKVADEIGAQIFGGNIIAGLHFHRYAWRIWNRWPDRFGHSRNALRGLSVRLAALARPSETDRLPAGLSWLWRPIRVLLRKDLRRTFRRIGDNL